MMVKSVEWLNRLNEWWRSYAIRFFILPSAFFLSEMARRGWRRTRAGRVAPAESANAQTAHGDSARLLDVARPIDEVTLPQAVRRLVRAHAAEGRTHSDREGLERTRVIQRRVRH